jgi:hypothetical protein
VEGRSDQRDFLRWAGLGTLGLGFGVSVFAGIFQWAEGSAGEQNYRVPRIQSSQFCLSVEGLVEKADHGRAGGDEGQDRFGALDFWGKCAREASSFLSRLSEEQPSGGRMQGRIGSG